jgi:hypothetical protein
MCAYQHNLVFRDDEVAPPLDEVEVSHHLPSLGRPEVCVSGRVRLVVDHLPCTHLRPAHLGPGNCHQLHAWEKVRKNVTTMDNIMQLLTRYKKEECINRK